MADENIKPGELTTRKEMREFFGGGKYQGIEPCKKTDNVLIYTDPSSGEEYGYYDGWISEEDPLGPIFEYTGAGRQDQAFHGGIGSRNKAIRDHVKDRRTLRVFKATGTVPGSATKQQRYIGEFKIDEETPFVYRMARNDKKRIRRVIVFRLRPIGGIQPEERDKIKLLTNAEVLAVPSSQTKITPRAAEKNSRKESTRAATPGTTIKRKEASLSEEFEAFLEGFKHEVYRFQIRTAELSSSLWTDIYDANDHVLYEAKGISSRESVRMAIGQLMDYRRKITPPNPDLAVLLPEKPHPDLIDLLNSVDINVVYRHNGKFAGWPVGQGANSSDGQSSKSR